MNETPLINKCCGIIPNSLCLVVFALIKIVADILAVGMFGWFTIALLVFGDNSTLPRFCIHLVIDIFLILDIAFMIIKIVGASVKCNHLLKVSYVYSILSLSIAVVASVTFTWFIYTTEDFARDHFSSDITEMKYLLIIITIILAYTLIHVLVIILIKSEIIKKASSGHGGTDQGGVVDGKRTSQYTYDRFV